MAKPKSDETKELERIRIQLEIANRLTVLGIMTKFPPLFPASVVATALSETSATPAEIARLVPGITSRSVATLKCAKGKSPEVEASDTGGDAGEGTEAASC